MTDSPGTPGAGPLAGLKIVDLGGVGPGPFAGMLLGDMGADVVGIDRLSAHLPTSRPNTIKRSRRSIALDLKSADGRELALRLVAEADAVIEGFRPGVIERLGLSPQECWKHNQRLVFGRMTGYGQDGPLAQRAGHDLNFLALTGILGAIGRPGGNPVPPLNVVADFGGGGMVLAFGLLCAIFEARASGHGQVVDASMIGGAALLSASLWGLKAADDWRDELGTNIVDGGAPFYDTYLTADDKHIAVAAIEIEFYRELCRLIEVDDPVDSTSHMDRTTWPARKELLARAFRTRTRDEWVSLLEDTDVCVSPVLSLDEAAEHHHNRANDTFVDYDGVQQPAPAPRLSRTPGRISSPPPIPGEDSEAVLRHWLSASDTEVDELRHGGVLGPEVPQQP